MNLKDTLTKKYIAYIDESGDEGIKKGTEWFILTAVIVERENDLKTSKAIDDIKTALKIPPHKPFHWKEIRKKHRSKKRLAIDRISEEDFVYINIVVNTYDINNGKLQGHLLYNYFCRYLLERISWFVHENNGVVDLIFSNKSNISYPELKKYLQSLHYELDCEIKWHTIRNFYVFNSSQKKMLQFADACASSLAEAFNKDIYGYYDDIFVMTLHNKLYRRKGNLLSYGLKIFPTESLNKYFQEYPWINKIK